MSQLLPSYKQSYTEYMFGPFGRTRYRWKDNIKSYFGDIRWDSAMAQH